MSLPPELTETVTIKPFQGQSAYGPTYGDAVTEKAYVEPGFRRITDVKGVEVTASVFLVLAGTSTIAVQDEVTYDGRRYEVVDCQPLRQGGRIHHVEAYLRSAGVA